MSNFNKESTPLTVSKSSLKSLKKSIEDNGKTEISFKLNSKLTKEENIQFRDIFRDLHYKKFKLLVIAKNSKFLRNLFEGYVPEVIGDNLIIKNY